MKDEEMADKLAEEYVKHWIVGEDDNALMQEAYKDGFLAGLKAGRPQWHDLRKYPNDLPKDDGVYLVYTLLNGYFLGHYEHNGGYELSYDGTVYSDFTEYPSEKEWLVEEVIAWRELPTFDKE